MDHLAINYYHRYSFIDEMQSFVHQPLHEGINIYLLSDETIHIIRALLIMDKISQAIMGSFTSGAHPAQVDDFKRLDWVCSMIKTMSDWHAIIHRILKPRPSKQRLHDFYSDLDLVKPVFPDHHTAALSALMQLQTTWNQHHAACLGLTEAEWNQFVHLIIDVESVDQVFCNREETEVGRKYAYIEPFFRGIHQLVEAAMMVITTVVSRIESQLCTLTITAENLIADIESPKILSLRCQLSDVQVWWEVAARNIMLLSKMDTGSYAEYRQALLGTSGGDSKQLRSLKTAMNALHFKLPKSLQDDRGYVRGLHKHPKDHLLNQLLTAIREAQAASSDFWMRHFTLTANTIGIVRGSQGLPVEKLISFAISPLMKSDSLLKSVAEVGSDYAMTPEAVLVEANQKSVVLGQAIYAHVKNHVTYLSDYTRLENVSNGILDHFELGPLEPNDISVSPYHKWFDVDVNTQVTRFEMHSFGVPLVFFYDSISRTSRRLIDSQNDYWETYFTERWDQFKTILFRALNVNTLTHTATIDVNATALLDRLFSAMSRDSHKNIVITTNHEFIAVKRTLLSWQQRDQYDVRRVTLSSQSLNLAEPFINEIERAGSQLKCLIFSEVFSNTQVCLTQNEIISILDAVPEDVPIVIDAVQGLFNIPCDWGVILANRQNVYLLGSGIKHARSTSGLGFMIYSAHDAILQNPKLSGWCAYLSGMTDGTTADANGGLLYDQAYQWCGGTPANIFSVELFINTWDAILRAGETIQSIHRYTQTLVHTFCKSLDSEYQVTDSERRHHFPQAASNALTLSVGSEQADSIIKRANQHQIYFDRRQQLLRIGFGIQHGKREVGQLLRVLNGL